MITEVLVLTMTISIVILLESVQELYGQSMFDIFLPAKSDND
jgi:hypothetical protein